MAADLNVQYPIVDNSQSISTVTVTPKTFTTSDNTGDVKLLKAFENRDNSLFLVFKVTANSTVTIKAGDKYPNSKLGDLTFPVTGTTCVQIHDLSRFENSDGSLIMNLGSEFAGDFFAVAKSSALVEADI